MQQVTIIRQREYDEVFTARVQVPEILLPGLAWIQEHCPLDEARTITLGELAEVWDVPEAVIMPGLRSLARTGFFTLEEPEQ